MPCPYSTILGTPGQGVHAARIFGLSINDIIGTILIAIITSYFYKISLLYSFIGWFALGEVLHYAFGTNTAFLQYIGMSPDCS
jgi:hypothetical protein